MKKEKAEKVLEDLPELPATKEIVFVERLDKLYLAKDVAKIIGCEISKVYALKDAGLLRGMKLGHLKFRREEVQEFLKWAEGKDLSDLKHITDLKTGEVVPHRFAEG